ncbi:MAG TPA: acetamidase/formamidase family protein [Gaiellaceae bacterium]|nr:acetamidase/formamidase family protein [Gaiellaceae bacterium]
MALHELPREPWALHGHFSRDLAPVLSIDPGDRVRISTPGHSWDVEPDESITAPNPEIDTGHALAGPIEVRGARAGQTLVVRIEEVRPSHWGVTHGGEDHAVYWDLRAGIGRALGRELDLEPFLGVMGMPPPEPGVHSTIPPRRWGGNIDCKELVAGTTLYLPIPVDGALFSAGDGHAAQGDGEVSGTAIETPAQARLTLDVDEDLRLEWPVARIRDAWLTFGMDEHLGRAAKIAVDGMVALMGRELGVFGGDALVLASVGADLHVTQVVNGTQGVHAVLRDDAFRV